MWHGAEKRTLLLQLLLALIVLASAAAWGAWFVAFLHRFGVRGAPTLTVLFLLGLVALTVLTGLVSLFTPLSAAVRLCLLALGIVPGYLGRETWRSVFVSATSAWGFRAWGAFVALGIIPVAVGSGGLFFYDTGLYHAQSIRWLHEHGTVVGLGNLHDRLAYVTSFWPVSALFSPTARGPFPLVPALALVLTYQVIRLSFTSVLRPALALVCLAYFWFYFDQLNSPAPDAVVACLILCALLLVLESGSTADRLLEWVAAATALLAVSIKPTAGPVLLLAAPVLIRPGRLVLGFVGSSLALVTVVRGVLLSGYVAYPILPLRFSVEWAIPSAAREATALINRAWALMPRRPPDAVLAMTKTEWLPQWIQLHGIPTVALIFLGFVISCYGFVYFLRSARRRHGWGLGFSQPNSESAGLLGFTVAVFGTLFWFFTAPDPRFGWAFLLAGFLVSASLLILSEQATGSRIGSALPAALLAIPAVGTLSFVLAAGVGALVRPSRLPRMPTREATVGSLRYRHPVLDDRCFAAELPCTPHVVAGVQLRGSELRQGFRPGR